MGFTIGTLACKFLIEDVPQRLRFNAVNLQILGFLKKTMESKEIAPIRLAFGYLSIVSQVYEKSNL